MMAAGEAGPPAIDRLHPEVRRWIWEKGWTSLRDIQSRAIAAITGGEGDVIIAAATAAGKTEAAFLPILSLIAEAPGEGFGALYVGPLKALINDQFARLESLCERLNLPVVKWHGDAAEGGKRRARERPAGVLLITPESIEALFVRRPADLARMVGRLRFIVIDELHAFLGGERGVQLASLMRRMEAGAGPPARRIGLSATLGDLGLAAAWLRPEDPGRVTVLESRGEGTDLRLQLRGIAERGSGSGREEAPAVEAIAGHLFATLRGRGNHLVFAGSRRMVETLADRLRMMSEAAGVPNEFFPHHGSLARDAREALEQRLKAGDLPTTAVATTTLEMGIDIGSVESVAEIGAPHAIAGLRQRVGRSGRRAGKPAILRLYITEPALDGDAPLLDRLRVETVQAIAAIRLLLARWIEPPEPGGLRLSTLVHQTLSVIAERGGAEARALYAALCGPGPFAAVTPALFAEMLRALAAADPPLLEQAPDGTLMLGAGGERLVGSHEFFAVFASVREWRLVTAGRTLGTLSAENSCSPGDLLVFGGQRWRIVAADRSAGVVAVEPAPAGRAPRFSAGEPAPLHDRLVAEMRQVYLADEPVGFLDAVAQRHLAEGRAAFRAEGLDRRSWVADGHGTLLFPWVGTKGLETLRLALKREGLAATASPVSLALDAPEADVRAAMGRLAELPAPAAIDLAAGAEAPDGGKFDPYLSEALRRQAFAAERLDPAILPALCARLLAPEDG